MAPLTPLATRQSIRLRTGRARPASRARLVLEDLERRDLPASANLFFPPADVYPGQDLRQPPVIRSRNGSIDATLNMVKAGFDSDPIFYGGKPVLSSRPNPRSPIDPDNPVYAMAYQVSAYGQSLPAQYPGPIYQLEPGESLNFRVIDNLAPPGTPPSVVFESNIHTHGLHVSPLSGGDNIYRLIKPGQAMNVSIPVPEGQPPGLNWYHVHRHMASHPQVYGGLAGMLVVGDPLDPWPQYKGKIKQVYMALSEVNIRDGHLSTFTAFTNGQNAWAGWQKTVNGQVNPTIRVRPGETQVWNLASIGALGSYNLAITDADLKNPWDATVLVQDGSGRNVRPYPLTLGADPARMKDADAATLLMEGGRLTLAVTAPKTPGTYYLIDGWGGQDKPAVTPKGQQQFYVLATIRVDGAPVNEPPPRFGPVGPVDPLFAATPDVRRTFAFTIDPGATSAENVFLINGKTFGNGVMPQLQVGTVEEWTLTNPSRPQGVMNHPFHIHQGSFIVTAIDGVPVDPHARPPASDSAMAYVSARDIINIPSGGSVTIRFRVGDFPGKYVFHCHILKHEDQGMMSPVIHFGPAQGLRLPFGTPRGRTPAAVVLDGNGRRLGKTKPFRRYRGPVVAASGLGSAQAAQTIAVGTGRSTSRVQVYADGSLVPTASFAAFGGKLGRGVSLAVGAMGDDGGAVIAAGSRSNGPAAVRIFKPDGTLIREFRGVLPGKFPNGVNVAIGDVNGDNFDDLIVSAAKGREPVVTALDGQEIAAGVADPAKLFTFVAGGGPAAGARVAVGYVAPGTVPSYLANLITTPEAGDEAGTVEVWNPASLGLAGHEMDHSAIFMDMSMDHDMDMDMTMSATTDDATGDDALMQAQSAPTPLVRFRPFGEIPGPVDIQANYQGKPGVPVIASWKTPRTVAFSTIDARNQVSTRLQGTGA